MPNWCSNTLQVGGDKEQLEAFKQKSIIRSARNLDIFIMDGTITMPKEIAIVEDITEEEKARRIEQYGNFSWYDWRMDNWGTRTDAHDSNIDMEDDSVTIYFQTAWSPPENWLKAVSIMYPLLTFDLAYMETGEWYAGRTIARNGYVQDDCGYPKMIDEWGNEVEWDDEKDMYKLIGKEEWTEDAFECNPFED